MRTSNYVMAFLAGTLGLAASAASASAGVTVGSEDGGNCYPFTCNDSGTNVGQTMDYQEIYLGTAVGAITINSLTFYPWPTGNTPQLLGGTYDITLGTTTTALGTPGFPIPLSNIATFDDVTVSSAMTLSAPLTFHGAAYAFNPSEGNLVMEVVVTNQDNVPNTGTNGYLWADNTGSDVMRAYEIATQGGVGQTTGALVTTFNSVPEPSTVAMMLLGFAGLGYAGCRKAKNWRTALSVA
jgi:hypothetical protein